MPTELVRRIGTNTSDFCYKIWRESLQQNILQGSWKPWPCIFCTWRADGHCGVTFGALGHVPPQTSIFFEERVILNVA